MIQLHILLFLSIVVSNSLIVTASSKADKTPTMTTGTTTTTAKNISPVCTESDEGDVLIFQITPKMRQSLHAGTFASEFQDFVDKVRAAFDTEGVVVIRGLIDDDLLSRLEVDSNAIVESGESGNAVTVKSLKFGPVFADTSLREVALFSSIPKFIAEVLLDHMGIKSSDNVNENSDACSLHLLKDAFLAKGGEKSCCGWHVDDAGFWPTNARSKPGVNAWIAIDDIPAKYGGGLGVSPRSHRASWRQRGYEAIGSTQIYPDEGLQKGVGVKIGKTCDMEVADPELAHMIDKSQKVFDFEKGDVLFHTRWLYHRSMPLTSAGREHFAKLGKEPTLKRYSIRYEYGDSCLLKGFMSLELPVFLNPENKGKTLAQINREEGPFYPRCWPESMNMNQIEEMNRLVADKFPIAEAKLFKFMQDLRSSFTMGTKKK